MTGHALSLENEPTGDEVPVGPIGDGHPLVPASEGREKQGCRDRSNETGWHRPSLASESAATRSLSAPLGRGFETGGPAAPVLASRPLIGSPPTMARPEDRLPENAIGKFYVDTQCIDCDVCRVTAPENFQRHEEKPYSYVFRQPATAEELAQCDEALDCCPVEAIGKDGA